MRVLGAAGQVLAGARYADISDQIALAGLAARGVVELDSERRAAMVSNLLVVLCGGGHPQPVVNVGSLYH